MNLKRIIMFMKLSIFAFIFFVLCYYITESLKSHAAYVREPFTKDCRHVQQNLKKLNTLAQLVHDALEEKRFSHFLTYGSIWGPLRGYKGPLPWDNDVDFGTVITESTFCNIAPLLALLQDRGVAHQNHIESAGLVRFCYANETHAGRKTVDLFLYQPTAFGLARRVGYEFWLLTLHYYLHHSFPFRFVKGDLEKVEFAGRRIQIPRDGIEIMKYLYRYDWWTVKKPKNYNCTINP